MSDLRHTHYVGDPPGLHQPRTIFESWEFSKTKGCVRLVLWPEGLVLWVGGVIVWREWDVD